MEQNNLCKGLCVALIGITGTVAAFHFTRQWMKSRKKRCLLADYNALKFDSWKDVGFVSELLIHPVKSAKGINVEEADATSHGLSYGFLDDRSFVVLSNGIFVTGRDTPKLLTVKTQVFDSVLTLSLGAHQSIQVDMQLVNESRDLRKFKIRDTEVEGFDCGDEVSDWLSRVLYNGSKEVRLIYKGNHSWTRPKRKYPVQLKNQKALDTTLYVDSGAYHVLCQSSLDDLNSRLESPVNVHYFRPPIVVSGSIPYDEDTWEYIKIGESIVLRVFKPCERCLLTQYDPDTGDRRTDHIEAMNKYRLISWPEDMAKEWKIKPILGTQCGIDAIGQIKVGDKVSVTHQDPLQWKVGN